MQAIRIRVIREKAILGAKNATKMPPEGGIGVLGEIASPDEATQVNRPRSRDPLILVDFHQFPSTGLDVLEEIPLLVACSLAVCADPDVHGD
jgi:hypothetical protein